MLNINAGNSPKTILTFTRTRWLISRHVDFIYFNASTSLTFNAEFSQIRPLFTMQLELALAKVTPNFA